ncbi:MAG: elongation factor 4, partial [Deltaproteobacteria bacterium]|nr:elongation factor 4 [Deltaproteobacteria bacterium]
MTVDTIRNFSIIAHIDHGKSTLSDRLLEYTDAINPRKFRPQFLDKMDLERERGITIKAQTVRLDYTAENGKDYILNLVDTPGHVDFTYEVSRSLTACEGAILLVDAAQGVEAQTLAHLYMALDNNLKICPVLNKIDLSIADVDKVKQEIKEILGLNIEEILLVSAKEGIGIRELLERIVKEIPPPKGSRDKPLKALIFDSWFDSYQGAVILVRVFDGMIIKGMKIQVMSSGKVFEVGRLGFFNPDMVEVDYLRAGDLGFVMAGIKKVADVTIGDTITDAAQPVSVPFPGFKPMKPIVFCGFYPLESGNYENLKDALEKLHINDSSFNYEPEVSQALGFGFRCGFLGLLHMEIIKERLDREFEVDLVITVPTVVYKVTEVSGEVIMVDNPINLPSPQQLSLMEEPFVVASIYLPGEYMGAVLKLCEERRGVQQKIEYHSAHRVIIVYELPLSEVIVDFHDRLKSITRGYASFDYEFTNYRPSSLVKLDMLINGDIVDALSLIVPRERAYVQGKELCSRMRKIIPRQMFDVVIQAAVGSRVISRETVKALRKNVTAKCYGGDVTRKRKLLERQKEGKKRMKRIGRV